MERRIVAAVLCVIAAAIAVPVAIRYASVLGAAAALLLCGLPGRWLARQLPASIDGSLRARPVLSAAWALMALLAVVQMGRLSIFMADASQTWGSTVPNPLVTNHQCLAAYVFAADMSRRGVANVYDEENYPELWRTRETQGRLSGVEGLDRWIDDRYLYPPPFLLLPRAGLALTNSFDELRAWWFVIQGLLLYAGMILLIVWIGGPVLPSALLLVPLVLASVPTMVVLQYGQFHGMAVAAALAGMVAVHQGRLPIGGLLLSVGVLSKISPALLGITLLAQRRYRAVAWTLGAAAVLVAVSLAVLGPSPYSAFATYQLPRLASGEAYDFMASRNAPPLMLSRNSSVPGIVDKLRLLGVPGATREAAALIAWIYTGVLIWLAWRAGGRRSKLAAVQGWIALLSLGALRAPLAPAGYVVAPTFLLLALLAWELRGRPVVVAGFVVTWLLILGTPPMPLAADIVVNLGAQAVLIALNVWVILRREVSESVAEVRGNRTHRSGYEPEPPRLA